MNNSTSVITVVLIQFFPFFFFSTDSSTCSIIHWKYGRSGEGGKVFSLINMWMQRKLTCCEGEVQLKLSKQYTEIVFGRFLFSSHLFCDMRKINSNVFR